MKYAVIGSRSFSDYKLLSEVLDQFDDISLIVSGGAKGADSLAEKYCLENELKKLIFYPDWKRYGKRAGMIRNKDIIENSDVVIAFWDYESKGTLNSIQLAKSLKKDLHIVDIRMKKQMEF